MDSSGLRNTDKVFRSMLVSFWPIRVLFSRSKTGINIFAIPWFSFLERQLQCESNAHWRQGLCDDRNYGDSRSGSENIRNRRTTRIQRLHDYTHGHSSSSRSAWWGVFEYGQQFRQRNLLQRHSSRLIRRFQRNFPRIDIHLHNLRKWKSSPSSQQQIRSAQAIITLLDLLVTTFSFWKCLTGAVQGRRFRINDS